MNLSETVRVMKVLKAFAPHIEINQDTVELWHRALGDLPGEAVMQATTRWTARRKHFPYPAEIREMAAETALGDGLPAKQQAWEIVEKALRGQLDRSRVSLPIQRAIRAVGGYSVLLQTDDLRFVRRDFLEAYEVEREKVLHTSDLAALMGGAAPELEAGNG